ncbi:hypothetical protein BAUCODRAFT_64026 [Baudoinia panamericana UAMH 10762]|uniref:AB hydrolase-1 domain-containing protein n=1 Tax=Baudoinia panamericana (strain UAMH 10762) TaxID=717646 RepID=M2MT67_BAUPA|nr:uncharacterized protein BAUCODRAFT_64026 [Baudoinia panamericana UAMH 10762]EMD00067.1 hypothetical protein BAUCODRAFT_64026 [Baudoinia panamericana UAMH 10762]
MPYATINAHRINYYDTTDSEPNRGSGHAPILMIHGLGSSQNYYLPVIAYLPTYRCIALDTYGAARSKSQGETLTLEELADDVVGLMDHLSITKAVVAGHSMGGTMVCTIAAKHPDRPLGIVAIGPVNPASVKPEMFQSRIDTVKTDGMEPLANTIPTSATNAKSTPLQRAIIRELILGQDPTSYASHCDVIMKMREPPGGFKTVKVPVLILAGEEDKSAPLEGCQYIHDRLGSTSKKLTVMSGVGHWHCIEAGEQVAREIAAFCSEL